MLKGERLDRPTYSFLHTLDEGNTAICHRGYHDIYKCEVVQKTISTLGMPDAIAKEPELLRQVRHDRIIEVMEAQWDPEYKHVQGITFVTPYQEGGSIYTALTDGTKFGMRQAAQITDDVLTGLDAMHARHQLLHRDIKPANILLDLKRQHAFVADLGCAAKFDTSTGTAQARVGSPLYRPPEAVATGYVTPRSDLYSLGVTMIEMLNGRFPYEDLDHDEVDRRLAQGRRALPDRFFAPAPWVPKPLASFVRRLCDANPDKRPNAAAAALRQLRDLRLVDWRPVDVAGLVGKWQGYWPPDAKRKDQRVLEVSTRTIDRGVDKGKLQATARWRKPTGKWRNYAKLTRRLAPEPSALAAFFNEVDLEAQSAPTR